MKQFSKIKETNNPHSRLRLCFKFRADEDPVGDLHTVGLVISYGVGGWHGGSERQYSGRAYILTDSKEDLDKCQEKLSQMGWTEMGDRNPE